MKKEKLEEKLNKIQMFKKSNEKHLKKIQKDQLNLESVDKSAQIKQKQNFEIKKS